MADMGGCMADGRALGAHSSSGRCSMGEQQNQSAAFLYGTSALHPIQVHLPLFLSARMCACKCACGAAVPAGRETPIALYGSQRARAASAAAPPYSPVSPADSAADPAHTASFMAAAGGARGSPAVSDQSRPGSGSAAAQAAGLARSGLELGAPEAVAGGVGGGALPPALARMMPRCARLQCL